MGVDGVGLFGWVHHVGGCVLGAFVGGGDVRCDFCSAGWLDCLVAVRAWFYFGGDQVM